MSDFRVTGFVVLFSISADFWAKVEKILKGSLDLIPSPSPSVKIQIIRGKACLRCKGKTLVGVVNKLLITKSLLTSPSNVLPYYLNQTFPPIIRIFTEGEGDEINSRLSSKIFFTLTSAKKVLQNLPPKERPMRLIYDERITVNTMISAASISYITP
jgi:hypothetical protein